MIRAMVTRRALAPLVAAVLLIGGSLPGRQRRLIEAWSEIHQAELLIDWERPAGWIAPDQDRATPVE